MLQISLREANQHLSQYIEQVNAGQEIIITKRGLPIARLLPFDQPKVKHLTTDQKRALERLMNNMEQGYHLGGEPFDRDRAHER